MTEIKEILDRINNYPEKLYCLNENEKHLLLDYITNLQQELEEEKRINQEDLKYIDELNERIEKAIEYIERQPRRELSVDSYFKFEDLVEFDELLDILKGKDNE